MVHGTCKSPSIAVLGLGVKGGGKVDHVFGSERLTGALLDRLTHHVHILEMNGDSYRLKGSRQDASASSAADQAGPQSSQALRPRSPYPHQ